jgi:hypothetical protein
MTNALLKKMVAAPRLFTRSMGDFPKKLKKAIHSVDSLDFTFIPILLLLEDFSEGFQNLYSPSNFDLPVYGALLSTDLPRPGRTDGIRISP